MAFHGTDRHDPTSHPEMGPQWELLAALQIGLNTSLTPFTDLLGLGLEN